MKSPATDTKTPADPAGREQEKEAVKPDVPSIGYHIYADMRRRFCKGSDLEGTDLQFVMDILDDLKPRDALERMLIIQAIWTHARLSRLSLMANQQRSKGMVETLSNACDRASNTFRRQMQALFDYRNPRCSDTFLAIKQANLAQQQVVHNAEKKRLPRSRGFTFRPMRWDEDLPPDIGRSGVVEEADAADQAVAALDRPKNRRGKSPVKDERPASRPAEREDARPDA